MRFERVFDVDLNAPVEPRMCGGLLFTGDNESLTVRARVRRGAASEVVTGSVVAHAIRADGSTVVVDGEASGNEASASLPASSLACEGPLGVMLRVIEGEEKTTILKAVWDVTAGTTETIIDPGHVVPDVDDVIAMMDQAEDAIDAANAAAAAADAAVGNLQGALFVSASYALEFMQGSISSSTGSASNTNYEKRIRTVSNKWYNVAGGLTCTVPNGFRAVFYYYDYNAAGNNYTYKGPSAGWVIGEYTDTTPIGDYLRVVLAREDDTNLTPEDVTTPVVVEAAASTDETLSIPGKAADAKAVNEAIAPCYKYGGLINEDTDLNDLKTPGLYYRWTSSRRPGNCPTAYGGSVMCFGQTGVNYQLAVNSAGNLFARGTTGTGDGSYTETWVQFAKQSDVDTITADIAALMNGKDQLHFSVVKGAWSKKGTIGVSGVLGICCNRIFELTPNSTLDFYLDEGWTYTIREGLAAGELNEMTAHLSNARLHTIKYPYVAINFNRWENGETVDTDVDDFDSSVIIRTSGTAVMETTEDDGIYHDFPETVGQMNVISRAYQMAKIQYTTEAVLPLHSGGSKQVDIRDADPKTDITGIPYSSMRETMASVPQATSFHTFMTAALNKNSYLYTKHYEQGAPLYDYNSRCYYGAVCSTLVAYCYGIEGVIPTTISFDTYPGMNPLPANQQNPYSLKLADMLNRSNDHIVIVTDIGRNYRGRIEYIEVTEAQKPLCRSVKYTPEQIQSRYFDKQDPPFIAYRYENVDDVTYTPSPWVHVDNTEKTEPVYSTTLSPRKGDKANWTLGETVEIDVMDSTGYTSYVLENAATETVISTASIPAGNVISLTGLTEGRYSVYLTDGTENGVPVYFDVIDAEVTYTPLGNNQVKVEYTSASNRVPSAVYWCANVQSGSDYKAVRAFHILTSEEVSAGYAIVDEPTDYRDADTVNGVWRMRMNFKTEFGLFASEMVEVSVT